MNRRNFISAIGGASFSLFVPSIAKATQIKRPRGDGFKTFHYDPADAEPFIQPLVLPRYQRELDRKIRESVLLVNTSKWVWTAESCQGHPKNRRGSAGYIGWSQVPMMRFVCRSADVGDLLTLVYKELKIGEENILIYKHEPAHAVGWTEFRMYVGQVGIPLTRWDAHSAIIGRAYFHRLAKRIVTVGTRGAING